MKSSFNRKRKNSLSLPGLCLICILMLIISVPDSPAQIRTDIRSEGFLTEGDDSTSYAVSIDNCLSLTSVSVSGGDTATLFSPSEARRIPGSSSGCEFPFSLTGDSLHNPSVTLSFTDSSGASLSQTHAETFRVERTPPELTFEGTSFAGTDGKQHLLVSVKASDDTDITYVGFSVTGLRASDLRAAGGVVEIARESAFAATDGYQRVCPAYDGQEVFTLSLEVTSELSADEIAHNGLVIADIVAADASGNQKSVSEIAFTGEDVIEQASGIQVQPLKIIFTNILETATLIPSVDYQFRGRVPLPGSGKGITYVSSDPDLVNVTSGGVVYP